MPDLGRARTGPRTRAGRTASIAAGLGLAITALAGCSGEEPARPDEASDSRILQPGRPGEPAATIGADDVPEATPWNHSDVAFMQMMIPHHAQALEMAELAETRAGSDRVRTLARRIRAAQGPEIVALAGWLERNGIEVPTVQDDPTSFDHGSHGHTSMAGMLTEKQMRALRRARGAAFDELFLLGMIDHHAGAVEMAQAATAEGSDLRVSEIAADVAAGQAAEIDRMRSMLRRL